MLRGLPCIARFHESASPESIAVPIQVEGDGENPAFSNAQPLKLEESHWVCVCGGGGGGGGRSHLSLPTLI